MTTETNIGSILRTKLHRPAVPRGYVHRQRLLAYLDQRRDRPLTLVSAPAGYGKSVLISRWMETCDIPNAWLSLDEIDSDLRQFLSYFIAAVQTRFPDAMGKTTTLVEAQTLPPLAVLAGSLAMSWTRLGKTLLWCWMTSTASRKNQYTTCSSNCCATRPGPCTLY